MGTKAWLTPTRGRQRKRGFVMVAIAVSAFVLMGFTGLAIDLGRIYVVKNELQTYTDSAALSAAKQLNGYESGITRANAAVAANTNKYDFANTAVTGATVTYAAAKTGPWLATPTASEAASIRFVQVSASATVPLYFIRVINSQTTQTVPASSKAGRESSTSFPASNNLLPFSPIAPSSTGTNYGFVVGNRYALRWPSNAGNSGAPPNGSVCAGDLALGWAAGSPIANYRASGSFRGFWGETSGNDLSEWIDQGYPYALSIGGTIDMVKGTKNGRKNAMSDRVNSDTDKTSTTYAAYEANQGADGKRVGNGRRVVAVPIHEGATSGNGNSSPETVLAFGAFFLDSTSYGDTAGNEAYCAQYIGLYTPGNENHGGGAAAGVAKLRLVN